MTAEKELLGLKSLRKLNIFVADDAQLSWRRSLACGSAISDLRCTHCGGALRNPVLDLIRNDLDHGNAWVILVALVDTILQVADVAGNHRGPMLINQIPVLSHSGSTGVGRPVCGGWVTEANIDVRIILDFLELVRHVVRKEREV